MALPHQIPDAQIQRMWRENFTHKCTVYPKIGDNVYGAPEYGDPCRNQMCFVSRNKRRVVNAQHDEEVPDFQVHFPGNIAMGIQYKLTDAIDLDRNKLFDTAVVSFIDDSVSSTQGRLQWLALAKVQ